MASPVHTIAHTGPDVPEALLNLPGSSPVLFVGKYDITDTLIAVVTIADELLSTINGIGQNGLGFHRAVLFSLLQYESAADGIAGTLVKYVSAFAKSPENESVGLVGEHLRESEIQVDLSIERNISFATQRKALQVVAPLWYLLHGAPGAP